MKKNSFFALLLAFVVLFSSCSAMLEEPKSTSTLKPTATPTLVPSATGMETLVSGTTEPVSTPTITPTVAPTITPTNAPTITPTMNAETGNGATEDDTTITLLNIPAYSGDSFVAINDNVPFFTKEELTTTAYENYSNLDSLGRCGVVMACCGQEIMPTGDRGSISGVTPSGWVQVKYDIVDGKYLYNRSHLIGWQLSGENANKKNLITGTRYFNTEGMLPFENMVADYIKETGNHVMYRVTPIYDGNNLVASGVLIEAYSVEDDGEGICFNVYCYNVQPGVVIDYATGASRLEGAGTAAPTLTPTSAPTSTVKPTATPTEEPVQDVGETYILNTNTKKIHHVSCHHTEKIKEENRQEYTGDLDDLVGYEKCKTCF